MYIYIYTTDSCVSVHSQFYLDLFIYQIRVTTDQKMALNEESRNLLFYLSMLCFVIILKTKHVSLLKKKEFAVNNNV